MSECIGGKCRRASDGVTVITTWPCQNNEHRRKFWIEDGNSFVAACMIFLGVFTSVLLIGLLFQ